MISTRLFTLLFSVSAALLAIHGTATARGASVVFTGNTVDIGLGELAKGVSAASSKTDLESLATAVTDRYHDLGYTTTFVEKVTVGKGGVVEVTVRESKIAGITVRGVSGGTASRISSMLRPVEGELYNAHVLRRRSIEARRRLDISSINISVENLDGTGDVSLVVTARDSIMGKVHGEVSYEPIYGLSPILAYSHRMERLTLYMLGNAGIRQGEFRKKEGFLRLSSGITESWHIFVDYGWTGKTDVWESAEVEYRERTHRPSAGMGIQIGGFKFEISCVRSCIDLQNYPAAEGGYSELSAKALAEYRDTGVLVQRRDGKRFSITTSTGKSTLEDGYFMTGEGMAVVTWSPALWLTFRSRLLGQYTTAGERYYRFYVYDRFLPGFMDDYSSTRTRGVMGIETEFELYPDTLYFGPLVNAGRFRSETDPSWSNATGAGASVSARVGNFGFQAVYAWDITGDVNDGSFLVTADGTF